MNDVVIEARRLQKTYKMGSESIDVLRGANFEIARGEVVSIVGKSGAGKSTLLHLLGMLDRPTAGEIFYGSESVAWASTYERAKVRRELVGFVFQFYHLIPELSAIENVALSGLLGGTRKMTPHASVSRLSRREIYERASSLMARVGLEDRVRHRPSQLSGGERQRVAIARALLTNPSVVLCDEPTGNLDERTSREIEDLLFELNAEQSQTLVLVTHNAILARRSHRTLVLEGGTLHPKIWNDEE